MLSSPVCDLAPELQTSEIPEGFYETPCTDVSAKDRILGILSVVSHFTDCKNEAK
jgi:hypothetical protein